VTDLEYQVAEAVGSDIVKEEMVGSFVSLLKDNEAEVRSASAGQLPGTFHPLMVFTSGVGIDAVV